MSCHAQAQGGYIQPLLGRADFHPSTFLPTFSSVILISALALFFFFFFFFVGSDSNASGSDDECCSDQEVWQGSL